MVVMTLVSIPLMDRAGRRTLHLYGLGGMFIVSICITISFLIKVSAFQNGAFPIVLNFLTRWKEITSLTITKCISIINSREFTLNEYVYKSCSIAQKKKINSCVCLENIFWRRFIIPILIFFLRLCQILKSL